MQDTSVFLWKVWLHEVEVFEHARHQCRDRGTLRTGQSDVRKQLVAFELLNDCGDSVVAAHPQVVTLSYIVREYHPGILPQA